MLVTADRKRQRVIVTGERFELELTWSQAGLLGAILNEKSRELMPVVPDKRYEPAIERDRR
jgi:hypothetical protein